jgi:methylated-DNA-[protein]-cysteine S-methyltransferase
MKVSDAQPGEVVRAHPRVQHLPLGALARIEQEALAVPPQQISVVVADSGGDRAGGSEDDEFAGRHGVKLPRMHKNGGMGMGLTVAFGTVSTKLGDVLAAVTEDGVAATAFQDGPRARAHIADRLGMASVEDPARTADACAELAAYFAGELREFGVDVDWRLMSTLQRQVLGTLLQTVPYGQVVTYGELATRSGTGVPARGIGSIMGSNPIPIIVPCHRVVAGSGLGGFSGGDGVESKRWLLTLEGYLPPALDWDI